MNSIETGISGKDCLSLEDFLRKYRITDYVLSNQVHGTAIYECTKPECVDGYDALVTTQKNLTLLIKAADCVPILVYDNAHAVIAAIHAGRRGTEQKIIEQVVHYLRDKHRIDPALLNAWIGPSICVDCYQIDRDKDIHYDLWSENQKQLHAVGVEQITLSGVCTACTGPRRYYSYRRDQTMLRNYAFIKMGTEDKRR